MCHDGNPNVTASGTYPTPYRTIAVDPEVIPLSSQIIIDGQIYYAEDVGGLIKGYTIDICMRTRKEALKWGRREIIIIVKEELK